MTWRKLMETYYRVQRSPLHHLKPHKIRNTHNTPK